MRISQEEIFGPGIAVIRADSDDEAIRIANDSEFGLAGSVWAKDESHAAATAYRFDRFLRGLMIDEKGQGATPNLH